MVRLTSARPSGAGRPAVPAKMTSSILPPRSDFAPCSPMTQARASTTFDLPDPFGPTTQVIPGSRRIVVAEAKDLKPRRVSVLRYTVSLQLSSAFQVPSPAGCGQTLPARQHVAGTSHGPGGACDWRDCCGR